jgi:uncharacterized membrane protein YeaQ/YmgE (transglycosylase-associated protein family)
MDLLWLLLIGLVAGWLAGVVMRGRGFGILGNLAVGVLGSLVGGFLFGLIGLSAYGRLARLLMAFVGAMVLLAIMNWVFRK